MKEKIFPSYYSLLVFKNSIYPTIHINKYMEVINDSAILYTMKRFKL